MVAVREVQAAESLRLYRQYIDEEARHNAEQEARERERLAEERRHNAQIEEDSQRELEFQRRQTEDQEFRTKVITAGVIAGVAISGAWCLYSSGVIAAGAAEAGLAAEAATVAEATAAGACATEAAEAGAMAAVVAADPAAETAALQFIAEIFQLGTGAVGVAAAAMRGGAL